MKNFFTTLFTFTKKDRKGIRDLFVILMILLSILTALNFYDPFKNENPVVFERADSLLIDSVFKKSEKHAFKKKNTEYNNRFTYEKKEYKKVEKQLSLFDPNTADSTMWKKMGLYNNQIKTIQKYLAKGGHFYKPEDVLKISTVKPEIWQELIPYIKIEKKNFSFEKEHKPFDTAAYRAEKKEKQRIMREQLSFEINTCTKWNLLKLGLIDSITSSKIIAYRKALGGFISFNQLGEIKDIDTTNLSKVIAHLTLDKTIIRTININYCSSFDLSKHPYVRYNTAVAIINYRNIHGKFQKLADLKNCAAVNDELFQKIEPYLVLVSN